MREVKRRGEGRGREEVEQEEFKINNKKTKGEV